MQATNLTFDRIKAIIFGVFISTPLVFHLLDLGSGEIDTENKMIEKAPAVNFKYNAKKGSVDNVRRLYTGIAVYMNQYDKFYESTFSFRPELLKLHNFLKSDGLHVNPLPLKVVEGEQGWYFPGDAASNVIRETKGIENFSSTELVKLKTILDGRQHWLTAKGIKNYLAIAPDKLSVYGDHLPILGSGRKTKLEQVRDLCQQGTGFIDLKTKFPASEHLFLKTDTHWNDYGAYLGYQSLMERIKTDFPHLTILPMEDFSIDTTYVFQQDLTKMISRTVKDEKIVFAFKGMERSHLAGNKSLPVPPRYRLNPGLFEKRYTSDVNKLKILMFRDSFSGNMEKFIKENFGDVVLIWDYEFNKAIIEVEKPDIVVQMIVEREIDVLLRDKQMPATE